MMRYAYLKKPARELPPEIGLSSNSLGVNSWMSASGRGCVKTQKHEIFADRITIADIEKVSVNPGFVRTNLITIPLPMWLQRLLVIPVLRLAGMIEPWEGSQTSLHALLAPEVEKQSGAYYSQIARYKDKASRKGGWPLSSPNPLAHDDAVAKRLWDASEVLVQAR